MFANLLAAAQTQLTTYPGTVQLVQSAVTRSVSWLRRQAFLPDLQRLWTSVAFTVNFGNQPELGVSRFVVTKESGQNRVFGSSANQSNFQLTLQGLIESAKSKAGNQNSAAKTAAAEAARRAEAARVAAEQAAAEAKRLADAAASQSNAFSSALSSFFGRFA